MRRAFTLLEVLVVVAVIGLLPALLFPVLARIRDLARRTTCSAQLHQIGLACALYRQDYASFPPCLSDISATYLTDGHVFVCPDDADHGHRPGDPYMEGDSLLATGESYEYYPRWQTAIDNGWWHTEPAFGNGRWDDLTPLAGCPWHWAKHWDASLPANATGSSGWELVLTAGGSVRKFRVETPVATISPAVYQ